MSDHEPEDSGVQVRASALPRTLRLFSAAQFERACVESGLTNGQIARALGKDESFVRKLRDGRCVANLDHLNALPEGVKESLGRQLGLSKTARREAEIERAVLLVLDLVRSGKVA